MKVEWHWDYRKGVTVESDDKAFYAEVDLTALNRPILSASWYDEDTLGLALRYGNGNSDPALSVARSFTNPPAWLEWLTTPLVRRGFPA